MAAGVGAISQLRVERRVEFGGMSKRLEEDIRLSRFAAEIANDGSS
jgi:hypothetical protein